MRRDVRILLVGDGELLAREKTCGPSDAFFLLEGVGKSTIVTSLIKESFVAHVSLDYIHVAVQANFNVFRSNTLSRKLQFRQKLLRRTSQPILLTPEVE